MTGGIFANCVFFLKVKKLSILEKNRLKNWIKENGGQIKFVLNHECTHVITDDANALGSTHRKTIQKYRLPVVGADFIWDSVEERRLLQTDDYEPSKISACITELEDIKDVTIVKLDHGNDSHKEKEATEKDNKSEFNVSGIVDRLRWISDNDENIPYFPEDFEVAKYDILEKVVKHSEYVVVELQCFQLRCMYPFRIWACYSVLDGQQNQKRFIPTRTSEEARTIYALCIDQLKDGDFQSRKDFPHEAEHLASVKLQEIVVAEAINSSTLSEEVGMFVELIWAEALGILEHLLDKPVTSISLNDVSKAEGILFQIKKTLNYMGSSTDPSAMLSEFYKIIPHKGHLDYDINRKLVSSKQDLCQLIRDMINVHETNMSNPNPPSLSKYRALRCKIDALNGEEFHNVKKQVEQNIDGSPVEVLQIYKVGRITEVAGFESHLGNVQSLIHSSSVSNFVGILSRGLLLPKVAVEEYGLERTDDGKLGSGIYFSKSISTSMKYSLPSKTDGTRLLVICDVALGNCWDTDWMDSSLTAAPPGYNSVHGVRKTKGNDTDFKDDEFVVYKISQVKIKYVVKFCLANDTVKEFRPAVPMELEDRAPSLEHQSQPEDCKMPSQDLLNDITAGLLDRSGNPVPLKDVHIKGRILDFVAEVVVFQTYENQTDHPIEAKYIFPLDDTAAVCAFEAFIKGKHIIGEVKEKEKAHQEYRAAVSQGHGAYLMDQDAPDIFTVSVGNLPASTKVLIKITYITELSYENGCLSFHLPAAVAPWQQDKALNEITQDSVRTVAIKQVGIKPGAFSLEMSIEMPFKINHISSWTHQLKIKKTDCKAVVSIVEDSSLDTSGFALEILIGDVHLPRMWVEKHPDKGSEACMLIFQPDFDGSFDPLCVSGETIICLDCSNSMAGSEIQQAKQIALCALETCHFATRLSVIKFGTNFEEFPSNPKDCIIDFAALKEFIMSATATMGNSDLSKTLRYLSLLYPSQHKRNILLISDGHIQNEGLTLQIVKQNAQHTRIFTCGIGPTANRHMLRSLSMRGSGAFEYFDVKAKYNWERKVKSQTARMFSPGCNAVSIKWQQFDINYPELMYAPSQIQSLFNHERLLVYGFISNCTQATLNALVDNQELQTMVSTTELQKTTGTMLHKLAARAFIRDFEQGILDENEIEHEAKKQQLKSLIIQLSQENSIVTQFTSFVAIEERDADEDLRADTLNVLELVAKEDVDILPYMQYIGTTQAAQYKNSAKEQITYSCLEAMIDVVQDEEDEEVLHASPHMDGILLPDLFELPTSDLFYCPSPLKESVEMPMKKIKRKKCRIRDFQLESVPLSSSSVQVGSYAPMSPAVSSEVGSCSSPPPPAPACPPPPPWDMARTIQFGHPLKDRTLQVSDVIIGASASAFGTKSALFGGFQASAASLPFAQKSTSELGSLASSISHQAPDFPCLSTSRDFSFGSQSSFGLQKRHLISDFQLKSVPSNSSSVQVKSYAPMSPAMSSEVGSRSPPPACLLPPPPRWNMTRTIPFGHPMKDRNLQSYPAQSNDFQLESGSFFSSFTPDDTSVEMSTEVSSEVGSPPRPPLHPPLPPMAVALEEKQVMPEHPPVLPQGMGFLTSAHQQKLATYRSSAISKVCNARRPKVLKGSRSEKPLRDVSWPQVFKLQNQDGFWDLTPELGTHLGLNVDDLVNFRLAKSGIRSLGLKGKEKLLQLIATLMVLQLVWFSKLEGIVFKSLMKLNESPPSWALDPVKKAVEWARRTDRDFPAICQRLELGKDWDSFTKKLLHI
ncbi:protein mono-ADP-ribosyltransferase PARP4 [Elgaria multicarinata webbii]|uniref:protein mono-ADP-ribosyltransferase PARP4 n=1 Tax=Elgaria multicarinata webbii TaxID=159646 RepID=UPI002FCCBEF7